MVNQDYLPSQVVLQNAMNNKTSCPDTKSTSSSSMDQQRLPTILSDARNVILQQKLSSRTD